MMNARGDLFRIAFLIGLLALTCAEAAAAGRTWTTLENCTLISNRSNDGDSFHVRVKRREYIFRLYFVDAPETDASVPARVEEQAKYFGITQAQALQVGEAAKRFTNEKLAQPFTVQTRMEDALGRSSRPRFYALVQIGTADLGEQLVENGLARVHGTSAPRAAASGGSEEWNKLERLQAEAKRERIGGWGVSVNRTTVRSEKEGGKPYDEFGAFFHKAQSLAPPEKSQSVSRERPAKGAPGPVKFDVNTASLQDLQTIPGLGPILTERIVAARPFPTADALRKVKGIGDATYGKIRPWFK